MHLGLDKVGRPPSKEFTFSFVAEVEGRKVLNLLVIMDSGRAAMGIFSPGS